MTPITLSVVIHTTPGCARIHSQRRQAESLRASGRNDANTVNTTKSTAMTTAIDANANSTTSRRDAARFGLALEEVHGWIVSVSDWKLSASGRRLGVA